MSWQTYVDNQICAQVSCKLAVIGGLSDGQVWAKYEKEVSQPVSPFYWLICKWIECLVDLKVTQQELKAIADGMKNNPNSFTEHGIHLAGEKYFCLQAENNLIRGRKGSSALCIVATNTCMSYLMSNVIIA